MLARAITHVSLWTAMIVTGAFASLARAEPELSLSWPSRADCPDGASVQRRVEEQLSRALVDVREGLHASATITRERGDYQLTLHTQRGSERGERAFKAASCSELAEAAALVLALSIGALEEDEAAASASVPARAESPESRRRVQIAAAAGVVAELGFLPRIGAGLEFGAAIAWAHSRVELFALWLPPVNSEPVDDGAYVRVSLWTARAGYCHDLLGRRTRLLGCGGFELGVAHGRGRALAEAFEPHYRWSAGFVALRLTSELAPHLGLYLEPMLALPFEWRRFVSSDADGQVSARLHEPAAVSGRLSLGAVVAF